MTQGEMVYLAVLGEFGVNGVLDGPVPSTKEWTKDQRERVYAQVLHGFLSGQVNKNSGGHDEAALKRYIPGLTSNWVRRDPRLNGADAGSRSLKQKSAAYVPSDSGPRADPELKALLVLLKMVGKAVPAEQKAEVEAKLFKRLEHLIKAAREAKVNRDKLPVSLRHLLPK